jgi:O-antigen/teichoic acid export membrane protein
MLGEVSVAESQGAHGRHRFTHHRSRDRTQGDHPQGTLLLLALLKKFGAESLLKNTAFLFGNLLLTTGCGFGALTLLTHLFSASIVGLSGTAVSACVLVQNITQFGVANSLPRFLPTANNRSALINTVLTTVLLGTLLVAVIFLTLPYTKSFFALGGWVFAPLFILAAGVLATEMVLGTVLVADRAADKLAIASVPPNLFGLVAPAALMFLGGLGAFISRVVSDVANCIFYSVIIAKRGHRFRLQLDFTGMRGIIRFSVGMHIANIIGAIPQLALPLIVFSRVGAKNAAYWGIAMSVAGFLFQLPGLVSRVLLPEASHRPTERRQIFRRSALLIPVIVLPTLAVAFFLAPFGLAIFGHSYATESLGPLRWLIVASFISLPLSVLGSILVVAKKTTMLTIANAVDAIIVLGLVLVWAANDNEIAISWAVGEVGNVLLFSIFVFRSLREVDWRWEDLGGAHAESTISPLSHSPSATAQLQALQTLMAIADQQRAAEMADTWLRRQYLLTDSRSLFTLGALRAAELRREQAMMKQSAPVRDVSPSLDAPPQSAASDVSHQQAFDVLFKMAERQRNAGFDPAHPEASERYYPYDELVQSADFAL